MPIITKRGENSGRKLKGKQRYKKLYHYTSFDSFVKIWLNKNLRFSKTEKVNDLFEVKREYSATYVQQMPLMIALKDIIDSYKQISLTMDYDTKFLGCMSTLMWGHYGNKRAGVCIELDFDKLVLSKSMLFAPIIYKREVKNNIRLDSSVVSMNTLRKFIKRSKRDIFFTKEKGWKGENEFRIISENDEYLDITNAITAVYLTEYDSQECLFVEKLVDGAIPVRSILFKNFGVDDKIRPIVVDTKKRRDEIKKILSSPNYFGKIFEDKARKIYEAHKDDGDYRMLMTEFDTL